LTLWEGENLKEVEVGEVGRSEFVLKAEPTGFTDIKYGV
jgi:hypothetical protein